MALTHDVDNLWRWTREGFVAAARRSARAARRRDLAALQAEGRELWRWATVHLPAGTDPFWTFPQLLKGERERGLPSTFFVLAGHSERIDGDQPVTYRRKLPQALALLRDDGRTGDEVGLHGNAAERLDAGLLRADRDDSCGAGPGRSAASATTTCAACTTRPCPWSRPRASPTTAAWPSPSTRASAAALRSPSTPTP